MGGAVVHGAAGGGWGSLITGGRGGREGGGRLEHFEIVDHHVEVPQRLEPALPLLLVLVVEGGGETLALELDVQGLAAVPVDDQVGLALVRAAGREVLALTLASSAAEVRAGGRVLEEEVLRLEPVGAVDGEVDLEPLVADPRHRRVGVPLGHAAAGGGEGQPVVSRCAAA